MLVELLENVLKEVVDILNLVIFCVVDIKEKFKTFLVDLLIFAMTNDQHEVIV